MKEKCVRFPGALIGIFGAANESTYYTAFAIKAFRVYLCMMIFACVNKSCFIFLQAMGKALESTILSMVREIVFGVGWSIGKLNSSCPIPLTGTYYCKDEGGSNFSKHHCMVLIPVIKTFTL